MANDSETYRAQWNQRFAESPEKWTEPDPWLAEVFESFVEPRFPEGGHALDLAGGMGRHAFWLAKRGWLVTVLDISDVAVERGQERAAREGLPVEYIRADALGGALPLGRYDVVMVFYFLLRELFPSLSAAVAPGGLLIYKSYTLDQLQREGGPKNPDVLLRKGELRDAFDEMDVLHYLERSQPRATAEIVAEKRQAFRR